MSDLATWFAYVRVVYRKKINVFVKKNKITIFMPGGSAIKNKCYITCVHFAKFKLCTHPMLNMNFLVFFSEILMQK